MNTKILRKLLAVMLIITLTLADFIFLAVYAVDVDYEKQETNINKTDVSFDAYFVSEEGVKTHQKVTEMNNSELKLFLSVSVTKGYLKDAVISIANANFKLVEGQELPNGVEEIDVANSTIRLNQISKGETKEIELQIEVVKDERFNLSNFSKETEVKLTGTFVNNNGKEIVAEKSIIVNLALSENAETNLTAKIAKYVVFEEAGQQKALLQISISSNVVNNLLPVKYTLINMTAPTLFGKEPESVNVTSSGTKATNGDDGTTFSEENYRYVDGIVTIGAINNANENNEVSWVKNSSDEYIVNLVYTLEDNAEESIDRPEDETEENQESDVDTTEEDMNKIQLSIKSELSLYNNEEKKVQNEINGELKLPEATQSVVSYEIQSIENEIAKGYMLVANAGNTSYKQEIRINIGYNHTVNNIEIDPKNEIYSDVENNLYTATTYYKAITINRDNLIKILGENGSVNIIADGITVATLNKDVTSYEFAQEISNVIITTSNPEQNGILRIETEKYIKPLEYDAKIINNINKLTTSIVGKEKLIEQEASTEITLTQPTLQISSSIKSDKLSTVVENKNVEMRVALQTNNTTNRLFKNPVVEIELPSYIEEIKVKTINVLYNDEIKAKTGDIVTNAEGNKVIRIALEGEQTKFNDVLSVEGTTLIIGADITVDKTAPSITQKMNVKVINNNEEIVETSSNVSYMAPTGIITLNAISGYNEKQEEITSMSGEKEIGKLEVAGKSRIATETITVINNYDYTCGNMIILGRTPAEGNKSPLTQSELGSTFTAKMVSGIKAVEGISNEEMTVYYSENQNASNDLNNSENGWTTDLSSLADAKSYLVIINKTMEKGNKVVLNYNIEIPEGLSREESTYGIYQVSYTNLDGALKGTIETTQSPIVGVSTGSGPELKVELSADVQNGAPVKEGQIIGYTIKVTNIGTSPATNITVKADVPNGSYYTAYEEDSTNHEYIQHPEIKQHTDIIESLAVGESKETKFFLTVGSRVECKIEDYINREDFSSDEEYEKEIEESKIRELVEALNSTTVNVIAKATTYDNEEPVEFTSNEISNEKVKAYFDLKLEQQEISQIEEGKTIQYHLYVNKVGVDTVKNLEITCSIPAGLTYTSSTYNEDAVTENVNGSTIKWNINELTESELIILTFTIDTVNEDKTISLKAQGTCDDYEGTIESNTESFTVGTPKIEISHSSNNNTGYLTEGDEIVYTLTVTNKSMAEAYEVNVTDYLSEGLRFKSLKYTIGEETKTYEISGTTTTFAKDMPGNSTLTIELTATADRLDEDETEKTVSNRFEVQAKKVDKISSSTIEHKVMKKQYTIDDNDQVVETSSISGLAWLDENLNGIRELTEPLIAQIPVILIDENGNTVTSGITDENGTYIFNNVPTGNYIVVFLYDMTNYDITTYGVGESTENNDAVTMELNIDGVATPCGATNVIHVTSNLYNVDIGLVLSPKFDLSLTKTVSKISVQAQNGTTTNTYNNSKLEKVELPSKYLEGATVIVEYAITVTNNGAIPGYATRIVDYLSSTDLKFNSETNKDWYLGTDGNIYNSTLKDTLIQPGESETLKLVLTKQVTERNTGLTNNTAEIYEAYNDEGLEDYNSTPANKAQNENDLGQADIIIGPKTGVFLYIGYTLILLSIMTVAIYIINKKVIRKM